MRYALPFLLAALAACGEPPPPTNGSAEAGDALEVPGAELIDVGTGQECEDYVATYADTLDAVAAEEGLDTRPGRDAIRSFAPFPEGVPCAAYFFGSIERPERFVTVRAGEAPRAAHSDLR